MKTAICECGRTYLIPNNPTERMVFFERENPLSLVFCGVDVGINREYLFKKCPRCSRKESLKEIYSVFLVASTGEILVDWRGYLAETAFDKKLYINNVLDKFGILSGNAENNWIIMSQNRGCINPVYGESVNLYFISPDDAVAYADIKSKQIKARGCYVMRIGPVFSLFV
jgi:hypothetical protein